MAVVLSEVGGSLADLIQTQVTLTDWHDMPDYNEVYTRHVSEPFPARTTFQGGLGRDGLMIEIESIAALDSPRLTIDAAIPQIGRSVLRRRNDVIYSEHLPPAAASYAHGVRVGDLVFIAGQLSRDSRGHLLGPGDIARQTRQVLDHLRIILRLADLDMDDIVKTTVMLTDWRHQAVVDEIYRSYFAPPYPARSIIAGGLARRGALIEIDAIAVAGARDNAVAVTHA